MAANCRRPLSLPRLSLEPKLRAARRTAGKQSEESSRHHLRTGLIHSLLFLLPFIAGIGTDRLLIERPVQAQEGQSPSGARSGPAAPSPQGAIVVPNGFGTGFDFVEKSSGGYMSPQERSRYAGGFANGLLSSGLLRADQGRVKRLQSCMVGMSDAQVAAILEKYIRIRDNPKEWHLSLTYIGFSAIGRACNMFPI